LIGAAAIFLLLAGLILFSPASPTGEGLFVLTALLTALPLCAVTYMAWRRSPRLGQAWLLLAVGRLVWFGGELAWLSLKGGPNQRVFPSISDGFFLTSYGLFLLGILWFPRARRPLPEKVKSWLDAAILTLSGALILWNLWIGPTVVDLLPYFPALIVSIVYPVIDLLLLQSIGGLFAEQAQTPARGPLLLLAGSAVALILGDLLFGFTSEFGRFHPGNILNLVWVTGFLLSALSGMRQIELIRRGTQPPWQVPPPGQPVKRSLNVTAYLPYLWLAPAYFLLAWGQFHSLPMSFLSMALLVGSILCLVVTRQVLALRENARLAFDLQRSNLELEERVRERTAALERSNNDLTQEIDLHQASELRLRDQRDFAVQITNLMGQGLTVTNAAGLFEYVNLAYAALLGYPAEDLVGHTPDEFTLEQDLGVLEHAHAQRMAGKVSSYETRLKRRDGTLVDVWITGVPRRSGDGFFGGAIATVTDLTERKQAEENLTATLEQLRRHNREIVLLNHMSELLQACQSQEEAHQVVAQTVGQLFPNESGALNLLKPGGDRMEIVTAWNQYTIQQRATPSSECVAIQSRRLFNSEAGQGAQACPLLDPRLTRAHLCLPLTSQEALFGVLTLVRKQSAPEAARLPEGLDARFFEDDRLQLAQAVADQASLALANLRLRDTLRSQALRDPLTNLFNRRYLEETLVRELARARRRASHLGIVMADIDHFKAYNDTYGHEAGDRVLQELAGLLLDGIRKEDIACRYGGEEFLIILPDAALETVQGRIEALREAIRVLRVPFRGKFLGAISLSFGISAFPDHGQTTEALLKAADDALFQAKRAGRDQVALARPPE
jgi:diguanylate cyclase (GGDEF)-like protein/PAS domain S-box-containing protein